MKFAHTWAGEPIISVAFFWKINEELLTPASASSPQAAAMRELDSCAAQQPWPAFALEPSRVAMMCLEASLSLTKKLRTPLITLDTCCSSGSRSLPKMRSLAAWSHQCPVGLGCSECVGCVWEPLWTSVWHQLLSDPLNAMQAPVYRPNGRMDLCSPRRNSRIAGVMTGKRK